MKKHCWLSYLFLIATLCHVFAAGKIYFEKPLGNDIKFKVNEAGDTICVGAVFADTNGIYIYILSQGTVVLFDTNGTIKQKIALESIGRSTYAGDDFIVYNGELVFANSVNRTIEIFAAATGRHRISIPLPGKLFSEASRRSERIVNRIYVYNKNILVGNEIRLWYWSEALQKLTAISRYERTTRSAGFLLLNSSRKIVRTGGVAVSSTGQFKLVKSPLPVWGKQYCLVNGKLCALRVDCTSLRLVKVE